MTDDGPAADPSWPPDIGSMREELAAQLRRTGAVTDDDRRRADEVLQALRIPELLRAVALSEGILRAADGFHGVAAFFVEGSAEREFILDVLRRARERR